MSSKLFGGDSSRQSQSSGFAALPSDLQNMFRVAGQEALSLFENPNQYFQPMGITEGETLASGLISQPFTDPSAFASTLQGIISPFGDVVTRSVSQDFEDIFNASNAAASQANAFGSSRQRDALAEIEGARTSALAEALINPALSLYQTGIGNLLGFGGFERQLDLSRRQALPQAIQLVTGGSGLGIIPNSSYGSTSTNSYKGIVPGITSILNPLSTFFGS
jgi:hypothetical protein